MKTAPLTADGTAWGWGNNNTGQLGDGGACGKACATPVKITGLTDAAVPAAGYVHSLAALSDGTMRGWGRNNEGELGDGTTTVRLSPATVTGLSGIRAAKASYLYDDAGLPVEQIDANGASLYFQRDQYGSTRMLTDSAGTAAATCTYDPYGNLAGKTGAADTALRWSGQYQDTDTGLYYLRAATTTRSPHSS